MIVMVSTKTLSAREPDHRARMKPIEITSKRPPATTSSNVGRMMLLTALSVIARLETSTTAVRSSSTWAGLNEPLT